MYKFLVLSLYIFTILHEQFDQNSNRFFPAQNGLKLIWILEKLVNMIGGKNMGLPGVSRIVFQDYWGGGDCCLRGSYKSCFKAILFISSGS